MDPDHAMPHEIEPAFHLLLSHSNQSEREYRVARAIELIASGQMDARGLFVLRDAGQIAGVIACEPLPGAGAILWPPVVTNQSHTAEDLLVVRACNWLRECGARLAQCLLPPEDALLAGSLLRNGFNQITTLSYLCRHGSRADDPDSPPPQLRFEEYDPSNPGLFHETLVRTYETTLDCPEANGVRTVEEVIEGHRQGRFDPTLWLLAFDQADQPVGVLMMSEVHPGEEWEVGYMGIVPQARRCGFGSEILSKAIARARTARVSRITLCVDDRNTPAWRLYRRMGFTLFDRRLVFLSVWQRAS